MRVLHAQTSLPTVQRELVNERFLTADAITNAAPSPIG